MSLDKSQVNSSSDLLCSILILRVNKQSHTCRPVWKKDIPQVLCVNYCFKINRLQFSLYLMTSQTSMFYIHVDLCFIYIISLQQCLLEAALFKNSYIPRTDLWVKHNAYKLQNTGVVIGCNIRLRNIHSSFPKT